MNLILLTDADFSADGTARLCGRRARHIVQVHRAAPGDELKVGALGGRIGRGRVVLASPDEVVLEVALDENPPAPVGVELLLAMPRPKVLRRLLQSVAALGVKRLVLVNAFRVEKSYFDTPLLAPEAIREELVLGLEQARDTILPEVRVRTRFKPFVEDELEEVIGACPVRLLAHPGGSGALGPCDAAPVAVAIGPEGGWIPYELQMLEARGFRRVSAGARILRVETAVPFLLGMVAQARCAAG